MSISPPARREIGLDPDDWRAMALGMAPVLIGAAAPWLIWASFGRVRCAELAACALISTLFYLRVVWLLGEHEQASRRRLGRRYVPPSTEITCAVCVGLVVTLMAPGLSAVALVDAVGLPRAAGVVESYDPAMLAEGGATLDLIGVAPGGGPLVLAPDGNAQAFSLRARTALPFVLSWQPNAVGMCIVLDAIVADACLTMDRRTGRLRHGDRDVGRVTAIGGHGFRPGALRSLLP